MRVTSYARGRDKRASKRDRETERGVGEGGGRVSSSFRVQGLGFRGSGFGEEATCSFRPCIRGLWSRSSAKIHPTDHMSILISYFFSPYRSSGARYLEIERGRHMGFRG
jgi:hypothetical protein